jgi:hypothetical protein
MKRKALAAVLAVCFVFIAGACAPGRAHAADESTPPRKAAVNPARLRVGAASAGFTGRVVQISLASETLSLKSKESTVTFDASSPVLSGYRFFSEIRVGDSVAVSYMPQGIRVARLSDRPGPDVASYRTSGRWTGKLRRAPRRSGSDFDDVDANKDGKITPVELSVLIPDVTLDRFRRYDVNKKGYLNRAEFEAAMRQERAAAKTK